MSSNKTKPIIKWHSNSFEKTLKFSMKVTKKISNELISFKIASHQTKQPMVQDISP
jgi:hypothetical protein